MSSIYKVDRVVDTVRIEMDSHVAEKLVAVLGEVIDRDTTMGDELGELFERLTEPERIRLVSGRTVNVQRVRYPSPLYSVHIEERDDEPDVFDIVLENR